MQTNKNTFELMGIIRGITTDESKILDEFILSIKNSNKPNNIPIDLGRMHDYYIMWCKKEKGIELDEAKQRLMKALADKEVFWSHLGYKGISLPRGGVMPLGQLRRVIAKAYGSLLPTQP